MRSSVLMQVGHLVQCYPDSELILGGDLNLDFARSSAHVDLVRNFCDTNDVSAVINHHGSVVDYT